MEQKKKKTKTKKTKLSEIDQLTIANILQTTHKRQTDCLNANQNLCMFILLKVSKGDFHRHIFKDELIKEYNKNVETPYRITDDNEADWDNIFEDLQKRNLIVTATNAIRITSIAQENVQKIFGVVDYDKWN